LNIILGSFCNPLSLGNPSCFGIIERRLGNREERKTGRLLARGSRIGEGKMGLEERWMKLFKRKQRLTFKFIGLKNIIPKIGQTVLARTIFFLDNTPNLKRSE